MNAENAATELKRSIGLPLLVFYGLGVTVGAGIFALMGEILGIAGNHAPLAFLIAGLTAGVTARAYALLAPRYPRAGGGSVYVSEGLGRRAGQIAGYGIAVTGIVSSAVIALAFAGYVGTLTGLPQWLLAAGIIVVLAAVAALGVRESLITAAAITALEVATLAVLTAFGVEGIFAPEALATILTPPSGFADLSLTITAAAIAFFAFIGFEDIVNMAEEAKDPARTMGPAIALTLGISILLYVLVAATAATAPDPEAIAASEAPLADLFASVTGFPAAPITVIAAISMVNGILVQIVMASRLFYGMARDGLAPAWLGKVDARRKVPLRAIVVVAAAIAALALALPILQLAQVTGYVTLAVFALVNVSLFRLASRKQWPGGAGDRWWGVAGAILAASLLAFELIRRVV